MVRVRFARREDPPGPAETVEELFDRLLELAAWPRNSLHQTWRPAVDIFEIDSGLMIVAELPGVHEAEFSVTVQQGRLGIRGVRRPPKIEHSRGALQLEIEYGPFERTIALPNDSDTDHIEAHFRHGLLAVHVPRQRGGRTIRVRPASEGEI